MAEDGGLCAMKAVRVPDPAPPANGGRPQRRRRNPTAQAERELNDLLTEVDIMGKLRHDNIVCYLSSAVVGSYVVLCMDLDAVRAQFGALAAPSVRRYTKEILRGLAFLHEHDIVHRDFKPGNVLLQIDGLCKLADFGASAELKKVAGDSGPVALRQKRAAPYMGTPLYMAPEAAKGTATAASDVRRSTHRVYRRLRMADLGFLLRVRGRTCFLLTDLSPYPPGATHHAQHHERKAPDVGHFTVMWMEYGKVPPEIWYRGSIVKVRHEVVERLERMSRILVRQGALARVLCTIGVTC
eukprot:gene58206-biopygen98098